MSAETTEAKITLSKSDLEGPIGKAFENAQNLLAAKLELRSQLQNARDFLNSASGAGALSDTQAAWVAQNLPKRTRNRSK